VAWFDVGIGVESFAGGLFSPTAVETADDTVCGTATVTWAVVFTGQFVAGQEHAEIYRSFPVPHAAIACVG
jgi:hypothetical protein